MTKIPEQDAVKAAMFDWRETIEEAQEMDLAFVKEALAAVFDGLISLEQRIASLGGQEWKGARQVYEVQEEVLAMRYKMILFEQALKEKCNGE